MSTTNVSNAYDIMPRHHINDFAIDSKGNIITIKRDIDYYYETRYQIEILTAKGNLVKNIDIPYENTKPIALYFDKDIIIAPYNKYNIKLLNIS